MKSNGTTPTSGSTPAPQPPTSQPKVHVHLDWAETGAPYGNQPQQPAQPQSGGQQ